MLFTILSYSHFIIYHMKKYWLHIRIGDKIISPILINDGYSVCTALNMKTVSCLLNASDNLSKLPIVFEYIEEGEHTKRCVHKDIIFLEKETHNLASALRKIFKLNINIKANVEIFFNDTEEGLCIGFLASKFKPVKYLVNNIYRGQNTVDVTNKVLINAQSSLSAKDIFILNYSVFGELLSHASDTVSDDYISKWTQKIASIPQSSNLQTEFSKYQNNFNSWIKLLLSWGLKRDGCKQYPWILVDLKRYNLIDNDQIEENLNYQVISPCWTIWIDQNGIKTEKIVSKGILKMI